MNPNAMISCAISPVMPPNFSAERMAAGHACLAIRALMVRRNRSPWRSATKAMSLVLRE
jgi:hypothetical protein